jgi:hypothetical protein
MRKSLWITWLSLMALVAIGYFATQSYVLLAPQISNIRSRTQGTGSVSIPPDVRANHWAHAAVGQVLKNGVMTLPDGHAFHGEAKVTHTQAVISLARLAQALEAGKWKSSASVPLPNKAVVGPTSRGWRQQMVTRYMLASVLARFGNYVANGEQRPGPNDKAFGQSEAIPDKATVTVSSAHPAYASLVYLTKNRMVWPGSPLLKPDDRPLRGAELSRALNEMAAGLNDRLTDIGHDAEGNSIDVNSKPRKPHN